MNKPPVKPFESSVRVSSSFDISIPEDVRVAIGIKEGMEVVFTVLSSRRLVINIRSGTREDLMAGFVRTNRHATLEQIKHLQPGTLVRPQRAAARKGAASAGESVASVIPTKKVGRRLAAKKSR